MIVTKGREREVEVGEAGRSRELTLLISESFNILSCLTRPCLSIPSLLNLRCELGEYNYT